jgi:hypothetical protein
MHVKCLDELILFGADEARAFLEEPRSGVLWKREVDKAGV